MADNTNNYCACTGEDAQYIVLLNQQGAQGLQGEQGEQGYSPVVSFIVNDDAIQMTSVNQNDTTTSPNLYDYLAKKDLSNTTIATDYMKVDGSNSADTIELNAGLTLRHNGNIAYIENNKNANAAIFIGSQVYVQPNGIHTDATSIRVQSGLSGLEISNDNSGVLIRDNVGNNTLRLSQSSNSLTCQSDDFNIYTYNHKLYYYNQNKAFNSATSEVATVGDLSDYVLSTTLSTTLADYLKSADAATTYLNIDGSNADYYFTVNGLRFSDNSITPVSTNNRNIEIRNYYTSTGTNDASIGINGGDIQLYTLNNISLFCNGNINLTSNNGKVYKNGTSDSNEVATIGDIPTVNNSTITITQGGTTKGTFTVNQNSDSTIELDSGITNPFRITGTYTTTNSAGNNVTYTNGITLNASTSNNSYDSYAMIFSSVRTGSGGGATRMAYLLADDTTNCNYPLQKASNDNYGIDISLLYDNNTLKVNDSHQLYVDSSVLNLDASNYVTLDSQQVISGAKTFDSNLTVGNGGNLILNNTGDTDHIWITNDGNVSTTDNTSTETTTTVMNHLTYLSTGTGTEVLHDIDNMQLPVSLYNTSNAKVAEVTTDGNGHLQIDTDDLQVTGSVSTDQLLSNDSVSYLTINTDKVLLGNGALELDLFGNATRPKYNNNDLALYSDVSAATSGLKTTDITQVYTPLGNIGIDATNTNVNIGQTYLNTYVILGSNNALRVARFDDSTSSYTYSNVLDEGNIASNSTITSLQSTITSLQSTIETLTSRIAALEANINGGNA